MHRVSLSSFMLISQEKKAVQRQKDNGGAEEGHGREKCKVEEQRVVWNHENQVAAARREQRET